MGNTTGGGDPAGDVVVTDAGDVLLEDVEDVFVAQRAGFRSATVAAVQDVYVQADGNDHRDVYRDHVADDGRDVRIAGAEDVLIERGALRGELQVRRAEDVYLAAADDAAIRDPEDVFIETDAITSDRLEIADAEDVHVKTGAVHGDVSVENPEHVHLAGDPARRVREEEVATYGVHEAVTVEDVADVHLADAAVRGEVTVVDADGVEDGDGGGLLF